MICREWSGLGLRYRTIDKITWNFIQFSAHELLVMCHNDILPCCGLLSEMLWRNQTDRISSSGSSLKIMIIQMLNPVTVLNANVSLWKYQYFGTKIGLPVVLRLWFLLWNMRLLVSTTKIESFFLMARQHRGTIGTTYPKTWVYGRFLPVAKFMKRWQPGRSAWIVG